MFDNIDLMYVNNILKENCGCHHSLVDRYEISTSVTAMDLPFYADVFFLRLPNMTSVL